MTEYVVLQKIELGEGYDGHAVAWVEVKGGPFEGHDGRDAIATAVGDEEGDFEAVPFRSWATNGHRRRQKVETSWEPLHTAQPELTSA